MWSLLRVALPLFMTTHAAHASVLEACVETVPDRSFIVLTEFSNNKILGPDARQNTRQALNELLGVSLLKKTAQGEYQSTFFSAWNHNEIDTVFDFSLQGDFKNESSLRSIESSLRKSLVDSGIVEGTIEADLKTLSIHMTLKKPRPRFFDLLTQIYPLRSQESTDYLAQGPYQMLCQKMEGSVVRFQSNGSHSVGPKFIDISSNSIDYNNAGLVISPLFSDEYQGFYDNIYSKHRTTLSVLSLHPDSDAVRNDSVRKLIQCSLDQSELISSYKSSFLDHAFFPIVPVSCDRKAMAALLKKIPKKLRNRHYVVSFAGQEQPYAKILGKQLRKSGLNLTVGYASDSAASIGGIVAMPIAAFEPGLIFKPLCKGYADVIQGCGKDSLLEQSLSSKAYGTATMAFRLFEKQYLLPLVYFPLTFLTRKTLVEHFEESPTELLNLKALRLNAAGFGSTSSCHNQGVYQGQPTDCRSCHYTEAARVIAPDHSQPNYFQCEQCHTVYQFPGAVIK